MNDIASRLQAAARHPQLLTPDLALEALRRIEELEHIIADLRVVLGDRIDEKFVEHVAS